MNDDTILANILRRGLSDNGFEYWSYRPEIAPTRLTIDGHIQLTEEELAAVDRLLAKAEHQPARDPHAIR